MVERGIEDARVGGSNPSVCTKRDNDVVTEWLGGGLQIRLRGFKSRSRLQEKKKCTGSSVGQSRGLLIPRSWVRIPPGTPITMRRNAPVAELV